MHLELFNFGYPESGRGGQAWVDVRHFSPQILEISPNSSVKFYGHRTIQNIISRCALDLGCVSLAGTGLPYWLKTYIFNLGDASVPVSLDFSSFNMEFVEHSRGLDTKYPEDCEFCISVSEEDIRALWEGLMAVVQGNVAKVSFTHVAAVVD